MTKNELKRKRVFEIYYPEDYGPFWMNVDNLKMCLRTKEFVGPKVPLEVKEITQDLIEQSEKPSANTVEEAMELVKGIAYVFQEEGEEAAVKYAQAEIGKLLQQHFKYQYLWNDPECQTIKEFGLKKYKAGYDQERFDERLEQTPDTDGSKNGVGGAK